MKKVAIIFGRFQPPTIGHYALFDKVKAYVRKNPDMEVVPICAIINGKKTSEDHTRNPLSPEERKAIMHASKRADGMKIIVANSVMDAVKKVKAEGLTPTVIAGGSDRIKAYKKLLDKYNTAEDGSKIDHTIIELNRNEEFNEDSANEMLKLLDDDFPVHLVSGSLVRHAAKSDNVAAVSKLVHVSPEIATKIIRKIKGPAS